jgi:hypothetical protein
LGQHIAGDSITVLDGDTGNTLHTLTGEKIVDLQVRPTDPLAIAVVEESGDPAMPYTVRIASLDGDLGEMNFRYYPHIDWSNDGSRLLVTSIDDPLGAGGVLGATVRYQVGSEQVDGTYLFQALEPDSRIDENMILDAAYIFDSAQGRKIGVATTNTIFRRDPDGNTQSLYVGGLQVADFRQQEPLLVGTRSDTGELSGLADIQWQAITVGTHSLAVADWSPDKKIAVMKPLSIDIYEPEAIHTPSPAVFILPLTDSNGDHITVQTNAQAHSVVFRPYP